MSYKIDIVLFSNVNKYIDTHVINNCICLLYTGLAIQDVCIARDDGLIRLFNTH